MDNLSWHCLEYNALSVDQLYAILRLRSEVFVVEQKCAFQDADNADQSALHVLGMRGDNLVAYSRLLAPGVKYQSCSIGRVATSSAIRGTGFGKLLMEKSIAYSRDQWPGCAITISAQQYLEDFYSSLEFRTESDPYLEDGILHITMTLAV